MLGFLRQDSLMPASRYSGLELVRENMRSVPKPSMARTQK